MVEFEKTPTKFGLYSLIGNVPKHDSKAFLFTCMGTDTDHFNYLVLRMCVLVRTLEFTD